MKKMLYILFLGNILSAIHTNASVHVSNPLLTAKEEALDAGKVVDVLNPLLELDEEALHKKVKHLQTKLNKALSQTNLIAQELAQAEDSQELDKSLSIRMKDLREYNNPKIFVARLSYGNTIHKALASQSSTINNNTQYGLLLYIPSVRPTHQHFFMYIHPLLSVGNVHYQIQSIQEELKDTHDIPATTLFII